MDNPRSGAYDPHVHPREKSESPTRRAATTTLFLACVVAIVSCQKNIAEPVHRPPTISSVIAFPTVLGPGDSTLVTVTVSNPDGGSLVYDWESSNGLIMRGPYGEGTVAQTDNPLRVFYRSTTASPNDTALITCEVYDHRGGHAHSQILIYFKD